jgi:hypothetical protein
MRSLSKRIPFTRTFTDFEFHHLLTSQPPETMDRRWHVVLDGESLDIVRSWTNRCIFRLKVSTERPHQVAEAWSIRQGLAHRSTKTNKQVEQLNQAIEAILEAAAR